MKIFYFILSPKESWNKLWRYCEKNLLEKLCKYKVEIRGRVVRMFGNRPGIK
jgi:hypothetical protein